MENEKRLIYANDVLARIEKTYSRLIANLDRADLAAAIITVGDYVKEAPTVDAVEVVHGEWLDGSGMSRDGSIVYESIDCSVCNDIFKIETKDRGYWKARFKVCPFCGAKMDGGNEDGWCKKL